MANFDFINHTCVVTGGNGYIGRAIGLAFAQAGADVILLGRNEAKGAESVQLIRDTGHPARFETVDLGDSAAVETFIASLQQLDILINCAGAGGAWLAALMSSISTSSGTSSVLRRRMARQL